MNKRGQFFLIAATIIVGLILSIGAIKNAVYSTSEETQVYDLSEELSFESYYIIDYGTLNTLPQTQIQGYLANLTGSYAKISPENEILAVYGNETSINVVQHKNIPTGSVGIETKGASIGQEIQKPTKRIPTALTFAGISGKTVRVIVDSTKNIYYDFTLKKGQNFFLVIKKQRGEEQTIIIN